MIYCINMMSGEKIPVASIDEVKQIVEAANAGAKLIVTKHGVVNATSIDSITRHKEKMSAVQETLQVNREMKLEEAELRELGVGIFHGLPKMLS